MAITTEQELVTAIFSDDNTKTIQDVIELFAHHQQQTEDEVKEQLKSTDVTDWSF
tara:strand:+ start:687 stop:851 length:165 start_codon:yes stop_codon:yes gene_type:complete